MPFPFSKVRLTANLCFGVALGFLGCDAAKPTEVTVEKAADVGRYQLVLHPRFGAYQYLLDTKIGTVWIIEEDPVTKDDVLIPIPFRGGLLVPSIVDRTGTLIDPEEQKDSIPTRARESEVDHKLGKIASLFEALDGDDAKSRVLQALDELALMRASPNESEERSKIVALRQSLATKRALSTQSPEPSVSAAPAN